MTTMSIYETGAYRNLGHSPLFELTKEEQSDDNVSIAVTGTDIGITRAILRNIYARFDNHSRIDKQVEARNVLNEFYDNVRSEIYLTRGQDHNSIFCSIVCAFYAHGNQLRKDNETTYILHPIRVANRVQRFLNRYNFNFRPEYETSMICAALLHDVIEDTDHNFDSIQHAFSGLELENDYFKSKKINEIVDLVFWLTDIDNSLGNRKVRKHLSSVRLGRAPRGAQIVKLADIYDNIHTANSLLDEFFELFCLEKLETLKMIDDSLEEGDDISKLVVVVRQIIEDIYKDRTGKDLLT